jgi:hypothetical protein
MRLAILIAMRPTKPIKLAIPSPAARSRCGYRRCGCLVADWPAPYNVGYPITLDIPVSPAAHAARKLQGWPKSCKLAQYFDCKSLFPASSWPNFWANPVTFTRSHIGRKTFGSCPAKPCRSGYIRLSPFSTAQPLYTSFPIIFSSCFSKVTIGYHPTCRLESRAGLFARPVVGSTGSTSIPSAPPPALAKPPTARRGR